MLWLKHLGIQQFIREEYLMYLQQSAMDLPKLIQDTIEVDVNRSFNSLKEITADNLNNILKTFAIVDA